jgi:hypothetical protein
MAYQGLFVYCTSTGSGYAVDHVYFYDGSAFRDTNDLINPIMKTYGRWHIGPINSIDNLTTTVSGSGSITNSGSGINMSTGGTVGSNVRFEHGSTSLTYAFRRDRKFEFHILIFASDILDLDFEFGLTNDASAAFSGNNDQFAVYYRDQTVSGNIYTRCNDGGATAPAGIDTGVAMAINTPFLFSIISDESTIKFFVNGALEETWSTNLPEASTLLLLRGWITNPSDTPGSPSNVRVAFIEGWIDAT